MYRITTIAILLVILNLGCRDSKRIWVNKFTTAFKENSLTNNIDWNNFEKSVSQAYDSSKILAIQRGLTIYGNEHSFYRIDGQNIYGDFPFNHRIDYCMYNQGFIKFNKPDDVGYVRLNGLIINPESPKKSRRRIVTEYIRDIQEQIEVQAKNNIKGWIIDLRFNDGGNMWPMLLSLRPFLQEGTLGYFISPTDTTEWSIDGKNVKYGDNPILSTFLDFDYEYSKIKPSLPKAVLIGHRTASSGEAVSIALESLNSMKYFGDSTSGFSTANKTIPISRKEYLIITSSVMANYQKKEISDGIKINNVQCNERELLTSTTNWIYDLSPLQ